MPAKRKGALIITNPQQRLQWKFVASAGSFSKLPAKWRFLRRDGSGSGTQTYDGQSAVAEDKPCIIDKNLQRFGADVTWNDTWKDTVSTSREEEKVWLATAPGTGWPP